MEKRNCPNCGAPIPEGRYKCEYCGTTFKREYSDVLIVERTDFPIRTLQTRVAISRWKTELGADRAAEYTLREMRNQLAEALTGLIEIQQRNDPFSDEIIFDGRVRVVEPTYRF